MTPPICVPIMSTTAKEACRLARRAEREGASLIEFRLDRLSGDIKRLTRCVSIPTIATVRRRSEGGCYPETEAKRRQVLRSLASKGFEYVDVELSTNRVSDLIEQMKMEGVKIIVSYHNCSKTPPCSRLEEIMDRQIAAGADICKIITKANSWGENLQILNLLQDAKAKHRRAVSFAMGSYGVPSRIFSPLFGGAFTYASLGRGLETAPGQITIAEMKAVYRVISP
ncbi:MAG: type I 3-dehydroquinate dehydratase [Candidatus Bathyarchaeia archaeon]